MRIRPVNRHYLLGPCANPNGLHKNYNILGPDGKKLDIAGSLFYGVVLETDEIPIVLNPGVNSPDVAKPGDIVFYRAGAETVINEKREWRTLVHESSIVAVVSDVVAEPKEIDAVKTIEGMASEAVTEKNKRDAVRSGVGIIRG